MEVITRLKESSLHNTKKEATMYLTVLWSDDSGRDHPSKFDIKEHEELQVAVIYLVKNGAKFDNQEIVKKVDWMPKGNLSSNENKPQNGPSEDPHSIDSGPPPTTVQGNAEQPVVINPTLQNSNQKRSMFDNIIPPHMRKGL